jgi:hypothetical protein
LDKKLVLALFVIGAIAVGLFAVLVIGLFRVDEDGRSRDDGAPLPTRLLGPRDREGCTPADVSPARSVFLAWQARG